VITCAAATSGAITSACDTNTAELAARKADRHQMVWRDQKGFMLNGFDPHASGKDEPSARFVRRS